MSEIVTGTAVVTSQVAVGTIIAPIALAGGTAALGYALVNAPFWKDIEQSEAEYLDNDGFCNLESLQKDFLNQTERHHERLLLIPSAVLPTKASETIAGLMAFQNSKLVTAVAEERFSNEFHEILNQVQKVQEMSGSEIEMFNEKTASLIEQSLQESRRRIQGFVAQEFKSAMQETGWTVKDEAETEAGTAYLATNRSGQSLAVCLDKNGTVTTDMAGFSNRGCETEIQTFFKVLERRGVRLNRKKEQPHYLFAGGAIINRVSKAKQILENAAVHQAESQKKKSVNANSRVSKIESGQQRAKKGYLLNRLRKIAR